MSDPNSTPSTNATPSTNSTPKTNTNTNANANSHNDPHVEQSTDRVLEHEYDGIREYDNPMPRWWLLTFAATIIFSVLYLFNIGPIGNGKGRIADYEASIAVFAAQHPAPTGGTLSSEQLIALSQDAAAVSAGAKVFASYCSSCHRTDAGGMIGPNLTDNFWLHGATASDMRKVIVEGVLDKGMPPWEKLLKPEQVDQVVAYVLTLHGSNPANPKPPQGEPSVGEPLKSELAPPSHP